MTQNNNVIFHHVHCKYKDFPASVLPVRVNTRNIFIIGVKVWDRVNTRVMITGYPGTSY